MPEQQRRASGHAEQGAPDLFAIVKSVRKGEATAQTARLGEEMSLSLNYAVLEPGMLAIDLPKKAQGPCTLSQAENPLWGFLWDLQGCPLCQLSQKTALAAEHLQASQAHFREVSRHQMVPVLSLRTPLELKLEGCGPYSLPSATQGT